MCCFVVVCMMIEGVSVEVGDVIFVVLVVVNCDLVVYCELYWLMFGCMVGLNFGFGMGLYGCLGE